ncbi:MAG: O-antigen ligase family protein [Armatimonadota bacterium]|nr:O-antigen ligase family protein [Armatimonadota bacterium]
MEAWRWRQGLLLVIAFQYSMGHAAVGLGVLMVLAIGELVAGEPLWDRTSLDVGLMSLIGIAVLSSVLSEWRPFALTACAIFAGTALVLIRAVVLAARRPQFPEQFLTAWAIGGSVAAVWAIAGLDASVTARAQIPGMGYNALGTTMAVATVLLAGLSAAGPRRRRLFSMAALPVVALALVLTWSRGAWLGAGLGLATLAGRIGVRRLWPAALAAAVILGVSAAALAPRWAWHLARLRDVAPAEGPFSRIAVWRAVPGLVASRPLLGSGFGTFIFAYEGSAQRDPALPGVPFAHNLFLNFAVETGLLGLVALLLFLGAGLLDLVRWGLRTPAGSPASAVSAAALAAFVALVGHQLVDGTVMGAHMAVGLYALVGLGAAASLKASGKPA